MSVWLRILQCRQPWFFSGSGRSSGEGTGHPLQYSWASLLAQLVKNPAAMWETWIQSLGWKDSLEKGKATHSSILAWRIPSTVYSPWGCIESDFHLLTLILTWDTGILVVLTSMGLNETMKNVWHDAWHIADLQKKHVTYYYRLMLFKTLSFEEKNGRLSTTKYKHLFLRVRTESLKSCWWKGTFFYHLHPPRDYLRSSRVNSPYKSLE